MKVNIREKLQVQWEASTPPNSQKSMDENVPTPSTIAKIGEDSDPQTEAFSIT